MFSKIIFCVKIIVVVMLMKEIKLKNCPNCKERIGIHDVECPYCKYIDDPKYKKYNNKLKNKKRKNNKNNKNEIYKVLLLIPIITYLIYLIINVDYLFVVIFLIALNILCMFLKRMFCLYLIILESLVLVLNLIVNIYDISSSAGVISQIIIFILGLLFIVFPKYLYIVKSKKMINKSKKNKKRIDIKQ